MLVYGWVVADDVPKLVHLYNDHSAQRLNLVVLVSI